MTFRAPRVANGALLLLVACVGTRMAPGVAASVHAPGQPSLLVSPTRSLRQAAKPEWVVAFNRAVPAGFDLDCAKPSTAPAAAATAQEASPKGSSSSSSSSKGSTRAAGVCQVCGGAPAVAAACSAHPACVAFVMDGPLPKGCGLLKSGVGPAAAAAAGGGGAKSQGGQTLYCNTARGAKCTGQFSFTPKTGMMFTGDYTCTSGSSSLCFNPGPVPAVAAACLGDPRCRAFAYNRADGGGYSKDAGGVASPTAGSDLYQRIA